MANIMQELGKIQATQESQGELLLVMQADIRCLQKKWWRTSGVIAGVVGVITLIGSLVGVSLATKRVEADYIRKDAMPVQAIVEALNAREAQAADGKKELDNRP